jgi:hypothetical protein
MLGIENEYYSKKGKIKKRGPRRFLMQLFSTTLGNVFGWPKIEVYLLIQKLMSQVLIRMEKLLF